MGLGVDTRTFLAQTLEGSVEAARDGAREETLDTGAEADRLSEDGRPQSAGLEGRELCVSISVAVVGCFNLMVAAESVGKQCSSAGMGSRRTSWTMGLVVSESRFLVRWALMWLV